MPARRRNTAAQQDDYEFAQVGGDSAARQWLCLGYDPSRPSPNHNGEQLTSTRRVHSACLAVVFAVLAVLGGVVLSTTPDCVDHCPTLTAVPVPQVASQPPAPQPAAVWTAPASGSDDVSPAGPVLVTATSGTITAVEMRNDSGKEIPGVLTPDG